MATGAVDGGDDGLMEGDQGLTDSDAGAGGLRWGAGGFFKAKIDKIGIFAKRGGSEVEREKEEEFKKHIGTSGRGSAVFG